MQGFSTVWFGIGILAVAACGSPAPLDEEAFPTIDQTGYTTGASTGGTAAVGAAGASSLTGTGGSGGSGAAVPGNGGSQSAGSAGSGDIASGGMGTTAGSGAGSCPDDVTTLFARPSAQGGCTNGGGCHEPGSPIKPDLVSPGVAARLLNVASSCSKTSTGASVQPRPYIGSDDSFLEEKIAGTPACGSGMPFFAEAALSAADEQCIIDWIEQVTEGAG
jgi:hypothetical protein